MAGASIAFLSTISHENIDPTDISFLSYNKTTVTLNQTKKKK